MTVTAELLAELETVSRKFRISSDQAADLHPDTPRPPTPDTDADAGTEDEGDEITVTWQRATGRVPSVLVTTPAGADRWAVPVPYRPDWLSALILNKAPKWWLK